MSPFRKHSFNDGLGPPDAHRIVRQILADIDLLLFEPFENLGIGNGLQPYIRNSANERSFVDLEYNDRTSNPRFCFNSDVVEVAQIIQSLHVAINGRGVHSLARLCLYVVLDSIGGYTAVATHP